MTWLLMQMVTVDFGGVPLRDALGSLEVTLADSARGDEPVTLRLTEVRRTTALNLMLQPRGLKVRDGVAVSIRAPEFVTKVYGHQDLLAHAQLACGTHRIRSTADLLELIESLDGWVPQDGASATAVNWMLVVTNTPAVHHAIAAIRRSG